MNYANSTMDIANNELTRELYVGRIRFARTCLFNVMEVGHRLHAVAKGNGDLSTVTMFVEGVISFCEVAANWNIPTQSAKLQRNVQVVQCLFPRSLSDETDKAAYFSLLAEVADNSSRFAEFLSEVSAWLNTDSGKDAMEDDLPELAYISEIVLRQSS